MLSLFNDGGLINLALESEMTLNNLEISLMREEASLIFNEVDSNSVIITKFKKILETLKKLWNTFLAKIKEVINKVVVATKMAEKFVIKYEGDIKEYKGNLKIEVNPLIAYPDRMKLMVQHIDDITGMTSKFITIQFNSTDEANKCEEEIKDIQRKLSDSAIFVNTTKKQEINVNSKVGEEAITFLRTVYPKIVDKVENFKKNGGAIVAGANREFVKMMKSQGEKGSELRKDKYGHLFMSQYYMNTLIKASASFISMMNQCYVDYYKICRNIVSDKLKTDKKAEK